MARNQHYTVLVYTSVKEHTPIVLLPTTINKHTQTYTNIQEHTTINEHTQTYTNVHSTHRK